MTQRSELEQFPKLSWDEAAPAASSAVRGALERVLEKQDGACLRDEERYALANSDGADLLALLVAADTLRRDLVGNIVSYVVNRNMNFTNVCFVGCKFCAFSRGPREADSYFHSLEDMGRKSQRSVGPGGDRSLHPRRAAARSASVLLPRNSARREGRDTADAHPRFFSDGDRLRR